MNTSRFPVGIDCRHTDYGTVQLDAVLHLIISYSLHSCTFKLHLRWTLIRGILWSSNLVSLTEPKKD